MNKKFWKPDLLLHRTTCVEKKRDKFRCFHKNSRISISATKEEDPRKRTAEKPFKENTVIVRRRSLDEKLTSSSESCVSKDGPQQRECSAVSYILLNHEAL